MDLNTITVADFKVQFRRDFPYLPVFSVDELYNAGDRVYYPTTKLFYDCKVNGTTNILPTVLANWTALPANGDGADSIDNYIQDDDITRAFEEAQANFNQDLWGSDANIKLAYLYITAHYLVMDLRAAQGGVAANPQFILASRSVGNVRESYGIPKSYMDSPVFAYLATSPYGLKYLSLIVPRLVGNIQGVPGGTNP